LLFARPSIATMLQDLTTRETLRVFASIRGIPHRSLSQVVEGKLAQFHMQSYADKQVKNLSGGMKRRLSLSLATLGDPRIIFLYDTLAQRCCLLFCALCASACS